MRKAGVVRPARDERTANLEQRGPAKPGMHKARKIGYIHRIRMQA